MTISILHAFTSAKAASSDASLVGSSEWNAGHNLTLTALSVIGRSGATGGAAEEITAALDGQVLRRASSALAFGALDLASANAITGDLPFANLTQIAGLSVLGVTGNSTADVAAITAGTDGHVLRRSGTALSFGELATGAFPTSLTLTGKTITLDTITATVAGNAGRFVNSSDSASVQVARFEGDRATMADDDEAYISLMLSNDGGTQTEFARLTWVATDVNAATSEDGALDFGVMTAGTMVDHLRLNTTTFRPITTDSHSLGSSNNAWSDLFLASGAVINFDAGDVTITHSAGALAFAGASSGYSFDAIVTGTSVTLTSGLRVGFAGTPTADRIELGDANAFLDFGNLIASTLMLFGDSGDSLRYDRTNNVWAFAIGNADKCYLDAPSTATQTALRIYDVDNAAVERVTVGAADSGGAGFKLLRIPN
jgi:hypothetical protein